MNRAVVKLVESDSELLQALGVRHRVFVQEQQIPAGEERDEFDDQAIHALAVFDCQAVGTGRVVIHRDGLARIGRMAVDPGFRGRGIGGQILECLEDAARARGCDRAMLHAQQYIEDFYVKRGYVRCGAIFLEVDIPHIEMRKPL